jgi:hypothetical protein
MTTFIMIASMLLGSTLFAAGQEPDFVKNLGLKKIDVEGAMVYYEPSLEGKLDIFKKVYSDYRTRMSIRTKSAASSYSELASKKTAVIDDIYEIVGGKDEELKTKLTAVVEGLIQFGHSFSMPISGSNNAIYLVLQSTAKDYLRSGGVLPNLSYDKKTDTAEYKFSFGNDKDNASSQELLIPVPSADEIEPLLNAFFAAIPKHMEQFIGKKGFILVHEVAELVIVMRLKTADPHKRWFTDGFANAITYEILRRHYSQKDADDFLEFYSTQPHQAIKNQIDLQYWMSAQFTFSNHRPLKKEKDHINARYCFATQQALRIVKQHGIECIKKILDTYVASGEKKSGAVLAAIQKATGDDIQKRMMQYQKFKTRDEGYALYQKQYDQAQKARNPDEMIYSMLRMLDLRGEQPLDATSLNLRIEIATLLYLSGQKEKATESITEFADWMCESNNIENHYIGRHLVIIYALKVGQSEIALDYARNILGSKPEDVFALTIVMKKAAAEKDFKKARQIAEFIYKNGPNQKNPCYAEAKQILDMQQKKTVNYLESIWKQ